MKKRAVDEGQQKYKGARIAPAPQGSSAVHDGAGGLRGNGARSKNPRSARGRRDHTAADSAHTEDAPLAARGRARSRLAGGATVSAAGASERRVQFRVVAGVLSWTQKHLVRMARQGRIDWLCHVDPAGVRSRELWLLIDRANSWMIERGRPRLDDLCAGAGISLPPPPTTN